MAKQNSREKIHRAVQKTALAAVFTALIWVSTAVMQIPLSTMGYIHLGDAAVLLSGFLLPAPYAFAAAGLGAGLADLFSGYAVYAPVTFFLKGAMALAARFLLRLFCRRREDIRRRLVGMLLGGLAAEVLMAAGYFLFEGVLYGFAAAAVNIPFNGIQGAVGLTLGVLLGARLLTLPLFADPPRKP